MNVTELRGYIKARCKIGLGAKSMHVEICVVYGDKHVTVGPGISLTLCCFVVYSTMRFVLCLTLCHFVRFQSF